jgi:large subunit ribosomal protein L31
MGNKVLLFILFSSIFNGIDRTIFIGDFLVKKDIHPEYQDILFVDSSNGTKFLIGSTLKPKETEKFEGKEYPVHRIAISSASHPFFTKSKQFIDAEGKVDKFLKKYENKKKQEQDRKDKQDKQEELKKTKKKKK